ncbi:MAG TPA: carbohydrate ABC transporter substrate-binding protein [Spirochaetia bacterium]|nr:carbohydrate ABC transporter substrate-binding protein [Spirochaetia bacterium]
MKKRITMFVMVAALVSFTMLFSGFPEGASGELEIFSWWAGDEGPALDALIKVYVAHNPSVKVNNATVTGGAGVNAKAVLKTRMLGGKPPDTFQVHAGQELIGTWVVANRMEDLTFLFKDQGWMDVFPKDLIKLIGTDKGIWSVPVNIHRSNVMWYIPANLKKWGVSVPKTWDEFFAVADKLKAKGVTPLALGENWTTIHLWESVALGVLGPDKWDALWTGKLAFNSADAINVWKVFGRILDYVNTDYASLSWQQASDLVINGKAAFNIMGDWAAGYFMTTKKLRPNVDFGWITPPGNQGVFMFLADSFGLPKGAKNRTAAIEWLKVCGSKEGQDAFNPLKGSVAARKDSDLRKYSVYSQSAAKDLQSNRVVGSLMHGVVANEGFMNDFQKVMEGFLTNKDADRAARSASDLARKNKIGR